MGYDYQGGSSSPVGSVAPLGGPGYDIGDTIRAYVGRDPGLRRSSSACRTTAGPGRPARRALALEEHLGHEERGIDDRRLRHRAPDTRRRPRQEVGSGRGGRLDRLPARELHARLRLRQPVAPAVLRRREGARPQVRRRQPLRPARRRDLGARLRRHPHRAATPSLKAQVHHRHRAAGDQRGIDQLRRSCRPTATGGWTASTVARDRHRPSPASAGRCSGSSTAASARRLLTGASSARPWRFTWDGENAAGSVVPDGTYRITIWTADASNNRASISEGRHRRPAGGGRDARRHRRLHLAQRRRPLGPHDAVVEGERARSRGKARIFDKNGATVRRWTIAATTAGSWVWNGRNAAGATVADGRYTFRVSGPRPGRQPDRPRPGRPRRPDDPVADLGAVGPSPRQAGQKDRLTFVLRRKATVTVAIYQGSTLVRRIWTGRALRGRHVRLDAGAARRPPGRSSSRAPTGSSSTRPAASGRRASLATSIGPGSVARRRLDWHPMTDPTRRSRRRVPRRPMPPRRRRLGRAADLRRGREHRARSRRPSSPPLPDATLLVVDDESPDGTGRLADDLAAADPRIRVRHRPVEAGPGTRLSRWLRRGARRRSDDGRPDGRRLQPRSRGTARRRRHRSPMAAPTWSSARATRRAAAWSTGGSAGGSCRAAAASSPGSCSGSVPNDLTGGFKAWRAATLAAVPFDGVHAGGYVFQIEMTFRASRARRPHPRGPDHLPRPTRRSVEDEPADRGRGAGRRRPAAGRGSLGALARGRGRDARRDRVVTGAPDSRLGEAVRPPVPGVRVVLDARPLQAPDRAPLAALPTSTACSAPSMRRRWPARSFALPDRRRTSTTRPTGYEHLEVVGRRQLPPTRLLRSGGDDRRPVPAAWRGASAAAWRAERGGAAGAVYHAVGGGPLPIASGLPVVATLLDLAAVGAAGRVQTIGRRAGSASGCARSSCATRRRSSSAASATARAARAAPAHPARAAARRAARATAGLRGRRADGRRRPARGGRPCASGSGSPTATCVFTGRFDARLDLDTLLRRLASLAAAGPPDGFDAAIVLAAAGPARRGQPGRPRLDRPRRGQEGDRRVARLCAQRCRSRTWPGSSAARVRRILPVVSEAAGLPVIEALASGTPVIASVGRATPRAGRSGRPAGRAARRRCGSPSPCATLWADDGVHDRDRGGRPRARPRRTRRTWADVARETRAIYAAVGRRGAG